MIPWPKLELHRLSYPRAFQGLSPFLPGGTLVLGLLVGCPAFACRVHIEAGQKGYIALTLLLFVAYVCGFVLIYSSSAVGHMIAGAIAFSRPIPLVSEVFSKNAAWRRAAGKFLGPELAPDDSQLFNQTAFDVALKTAQTIPDEVLRIAETQRVYLEHAPRYFSDFAWQNWYDAMLNYFYPNRFEWNLEVMYSMAVFQAIGWSGIFLFSVIPFFRHPLFIAVSVVTALLGLVYPVAVYETLRKRDPSHVQVMASLIAEFRKDKAQSTPQK